MTHSSADLTAFARIRNAALEGFAQHGVTATSIRDIARAAGVSAGTVQHHFPSKDDLRSAVDEHVIKTMVAAFAELPATSSPADAQRALGDRVTAVVGEHSTALRYVARLVSEGDPGGIRIFDEFVSIARQQWQAMHDAGLLRADLDLTWLALHGVVITLGSVLLHAAIDGQLGAPFLSPAELERWNTATNKLFRLGVYGGNP